MLNVDSKASNPVITFCPRQFVFAGRSRYGLHCNFYSLPVPKDTHQHCSVQQHSVLSETKKDIRKTLAAMIGCGS